MNRKHHLLFCSQDWSFQQTVCLHWLTSSQHRTSPSSLLCRNSRNGSSSTPRVSLIHPTHSLGWTTRLHGCWTHLRPLFLKGSDSSDSLCTTVSRTAAPLFCTLTPLRCWGQSCHTELDDSQMWSSGCTEKRFQGFFFVVVVVAACLFCFFKSPETFVFT